MSRWHAYLNISCKIINQYDGAVPLPAWLKNHFKLNRKMGSKDRKFVSEAVYSFYRLGHAFKDIPIEDRVLTGIFLCHENGNEMLQALKPEWNSLMQLPVAEKIKYAGDAAALSEIFPWRQELSEGIDEEIFNLSFLSQPELFLRLRPGKEALVREKLRKAGIAFRDVNLHCIILENSTKASSILEINREAVVQDYSSQRTGSFMQFEGKVWDCCAASGGKSIMAQDLNPGIHLTVSDVRQSIMHNLHQRFRTAGIKNYDSFVADLSAGSVAVRNSPFDVILADLPCTGSGTWGRNPEQLYFFDISRVKYYSDLQKRLLVNVIPYLKHGGQLVYITCSVFKEENEYVVEFARHTLGLLLVEMQLLKGYGLKADSMFVAVFRSVK